MKIAVSSTGTTLESEVDPRFGRCQFFIVVDPDSDKYEVISNASAVSPGGAGISAAQMIADRKVDAVLTGNCGPNAYQILSAAGIQVITGVTGKVKNVIEDYKAGKFKASAQPNVPDHFGPGGRGMGRGMGMGRGQGGGRGVGMGGDMGFGCMGFTDTQSTQSSESSQDIQSLKAESEALAEYLADIQRRISELEGKAKQK